MQNILKFITISMIVLTLSVVITAQKGKGMLTYEPYVFESSKNEKVEATLGTLKVPENRAKKNGRMIKLKFVRFKSTSKNPGSPIVYLAGGPGGSGILSAKYGRFPLFMAMREIADVIALDQRGTGMSEPAMGCPERLSYPIEKVPDRDEFLRIYKEGAKKCAEGFRKKGVDLFAYNTNSSADDLEDLRKAFGAKKLSLWGISYGTHLALATIKQHENSIDKAILAGVEGPDHTLKLPGNIQQHLVNLDALLKDDPELNRKIPSLLKLMKEVFEKLDREPVIIEVTDPKTKRRVNITVNKFLVQLLTVFAFGSSDEALPLAFYGMSQGNFDQAAGRWVSAISSGRRVGSAMTFMMDCHSGASSDRLKQIQMESRETLLGNVMNLPFPEICDAWSNPDVGDSFRKPVKTKVPTLFISGTLDVRTPPSNAEEVRSGFRNSTHLIINGAVHSDPLFLSSPKIKETMLKFMKGEDLPDSYNIEMTKPFKLMPLPQS